MPRLEPNRILCVAFLVAISTGAFANAADIRIRARVTVTGNVVRLNDVAQIAEPNTALRRQLEDIVLGPAPAPGNAVRIDYSAIRSRVQAGGISLVSTRFSGRTNVIVTRSNRSSGIQQVSSTRESKRRRPVTRREKAEDALAVALKNYLQRVAPQYGNATIAVQLRSRDVPVVQAAGNADVQIDGFRSPISDSQLLRFQFTAGNATKRTIYATCHIGSKPQVLVAKYAIPRGEVVQAADLTFRTVERSGRGISNIQQIAGHVAKTTIAKHAVIQRTHIRRVPLVRRGQIVTVYSRRPGITIKREMKARTEGAMGDTVTLVELKGGNAVTARVIGLHKAEVSSSSDIGKRTPSHNGGIQFRKATTARQDKNKSRADQIRRLLRQRYDKDRRGRRP